MKLQNQQRNTRLSLKDFLNNLVSEMFGVEGRLPRTVKVLLLKPGKLTTEYFSENSQKFISPIALYFTINLFFFLLLPLINTENVKFLSFSYSGFTMAEGFYQNQIKLDFSVSNLSLEVYKAMFDAHITYNQPALIFFIIPFFALLLGIAEFRCKRYYVEHLIFALHFMSFFLLLFLLISSVISFSVWLTEMVENQFYTIQIFKFVSILFIILFVVYLFQAVRNYYGHKILATVGKTLFLAIGFVGIFLGYINFLFFYTLINIG